MFNAFHILLTDNDWDHIESIIGGIGAFIFFMFFAYFMIFKD